MAAWRAMGVGALLACACGGGGQNPLNPRLQEEGADAAFDAGAGDALLPDAAVPRDAGGDAEGPDAAMKPDAGGRADAAAPGPDAGFPPVYTSLTLDLEATNTTHKVLAVDLQGRIFAIDPADSWGRLWVSTDGAHWSLRSVYAGHGFLRMNALWDGVLLADTGSGGEHFLSRSTDHGATWTDVLPLGDRRWLQPHSVVELGGTVFFAEYQTTSAAPVPIHLWASTDRGATWSVRHTFEGYRHAHALLADPVAGWLWAFMGDPTGATLRSKDGGFTWSVVIPGFPGVVVDAVTTPFGGLLFGTDGLYLPAQPQIQRLLPGDRLRVLQPLPGPSYSVHRTRPFGYLMGTTRETGGDVYPPGDDSAHLLSSVDGDTWTEILAYPRLDPASYGRIDVYWELPDWRVIVEVENAAGFGGDGSGFHLARPVLR